jgi:hypothetical protein
MVLVVTGKKARDATVPMVVPPCRCRINNATQCHGSHAHGLPLGSSLRVEASGSPLSRFILQSTLSQRFIPLGDSYLLVNDRRAIFTTRREQFERMAISRRCRVLRNFTMKNESGMSFTFTLR